MKTIPANPNLFDHLANFVHLHGSAIAMLTIFAIAWAIFLVFLLNSIGQDVKTIRRNKP